MSKRTLRRAAERAARKSAHSLTPPPVQAEKSMAATAMANSYHPADPDPAEPPAGNASSARVNVDRAAINRENAQKSTGPITPEGKQICSQNAVKHGLTGNTVLLDSDDVDAYQERLDAHVAQFKPVTFEERRLVQSIHDCAWRLDRILNHESTIYAVGRMELQFCFSQAPEELRRSFIELEILERNSKKLRNLHIQEARLQRQRAKDIAALKQLIQERQAEEQATVEPPKPAAQPAPVATNGSVFENSPTAPPPSPNTGPQPASQPNRMEQN